MRYGSNARHVEHVESRIAERLTKHEPRIWPDGGAERIDIAGIHERRVDAETPQGVMQEVVRAAIERARRDNVRARSHQGRDGEVQRGLAARHGNRADAAFERGDAFLQHGARRVRDARVDVARALHVEQRRCVVAVLEDKTRGLVDRRCARAVKRIRLLARMQAQRIEVEGFGTGHGTSDGGSIVTRRCGSTAARISSAA